MMYGDLLMANALAKATGKSAFDVIRVRAKRKIGRSGGRASGHGVVPSNDCTQDRASADLAASGGARSRNQTGEQKIEDLGISPSHSLRPGGEGPLPGPRLFGLGN